MKKILLLLLFLAPSSLLLAQPKGATKALLKVTTYGADGNVLRRGTAFFIDANGTGLASYALFEYATRAEAVDERGTLYPITSILGGSSMVDLVKFRAETAKKVSYLTLTSSSIPVQTQAFLLYFQNEKPQQQATTVTASTPYQQLHYYDIATTNDAAYAGCPLVTTEGKVFGVYQKNVSKGATTACAMDTRFADSLNISSTSTFNNDLQKIFIRKALPTDPAQARAYIFLQANTDSAYYVSLLNEYVNAFPENAEGWVDRAAFFAHRRNYSLATADFSKALSLTEKQSGSYGRDEVHYAWSKALYEKELYAPFVQEAGWSLDRALEEIRKAYALNPLPFYKKQEGSYLFAKQDYAAAYACFAAVNKTDFASAETYFNAAQALERLGTDTALLSATLDSMMQRFSQPYTLEAAPYLLARAGFYNRMERYRAALADLNEYERLIGKDRLGAQFFYTREQVSLAARLYQLAVNDIEEAIRRAPQNTFFLIEEALVYLRAGEYAIAKEKAAATLQLIPENPDCYKVLGIATGELGDKATAIEHLEKAKALGDDSVQPFIERYSH